MTADPTPATEHRLIGSGCTCGDWSAGCGNDIPEQWRQHVNAATKRPTPATGADQGGALTEGACVCHGSDRPHAPHRPCDMGCQPDWHKDGCAIYLPVPPADQGGALTEAEREWLLDHVFTSGPGGRADLIAAVERIVAARLEPITNLLREYELGTRTALGTLIAVEHALDGGDR